MPRIRAGDINLEYYIEGNGPPLLMIMGFAGQATSWGDQVLKRLREHFTTITFSNRGSGASEGVDTEITVTGMADDAIALLDALDIKHPHIFGISMGGMIAQEIAINYPDRVNGLVLGCTTAGFAHGTPPNPDDIKGMTPDPGLSREEMIRNFWYVVCAPDFIEKTGVEFLADMLKRSMEQPTPPMTLMKQVAAVQVFDVFGRLGEIKAPTLIIHGDIDLLVPCANAPVLHEGIAGSEFKTLPGCAHMFFWEQPDETADAVIEFLSRVPAEA
jgi:3-oxoadipate enol-lactonase